MTTQSLLSSSPDLKIPFIPLTYSLDESQPSALGIIRTLRHEWEEDKIEITRFTDGTTNTLLKIVHKLPGLSTEEMEHEAILLRAYGQGTELIIDREREAQNHELLMPFKITANKMFRTTPQHRRGAAAVPDNKLYIVVRGSVKSLWSLLTKHAARTSRKFSSGNSSPTKLMSTISNKAINFRRKKRVSGEEVDGGVWRRTILMGDKCQPLDFSGVIYYDNDGNRVSELPSRSPRTSPLPSYAYKTEGDDKSRLGW